MQLAVLNIPPKGFSGQSELSYPAEKGGLVLDGHLLLKVGGKLSELHPGDGFVFDGSQPHSFRNDGDVSARVVWIIVRRLIGEHI